MQKCSKCKRSVKFVKKDPNHGEKDWLCPKCFDEFMAKLIGDYGETLRKLGEE